MRDIDPRTSRFKIEPKTVLSREGEANATATVLRRRIAIVLAVAALCVATAGCAVDVGHTKLEKTDDSNQLRYYGGPKYPMWRE